MEYPGGKNCSGTYQRIINHMPPHTRYIEMFAGSAAIMRYKKPAAQSIAIDVDAAAIDTLRRSMDIPADCELVNGYATSWIAEHESILDRHTLIYADPPYLMSTRRSHRQLYLYEMSDDDHVSLLNLLLSVPCMVMISGYWSELYDQKLTGWRVDTWQQITRGGEMATEWLWMNFTEPLELHDYRYLGSDFRERERIKRKVSRWKNRLQTMAHKDRIAIMAAIDELRAGRIDKIDDTGRDLSS